MEQMNTGQAIVGKIKRVKLIKMDTWISKNVWYKYAKAYKKKNQFDPIKIFTDRSPCQDPYFDSAGKAFVSGLCRGKMVGKQYDILIYYTNGCSEFFRDEFFTDIDFDKEKVKNYVKNHIVVLKALYVSRTPYTSHKEFLEKNQNIDQPPNVFGVTRGGAKDGRNLFYDFKINPIEPSKSVCYDFRDDKPRPKTPDKETFDHGLGVYQGQIDFYIGRFLTKKLKVLECDTFKIKGQNRYCFLEKSGVEIKNNGKVEVPFTTIGAAQNGYVIYDSNTLINYGTKDEPIHRNNAGYKKLAEYFLQKFFNANEIQL